MTTISIDQIVLLLPRPIEPNEEAFALRILLDQNRVSDTILVEFIESKLLLRATFHASSNPFTQARIFLQRKLVPLTVSDVSQFALIISKLAQQGARDVLLSDACKALFEKYQIELDTKPLPLIRIRGPREQHGNAL